LLKTLAEYGGLDMIGLTGEKAVIAEETAVAAVSHFPLAEVNQRTP